MAITVNNIQSSAGDSLAYTPSSVTDSCLVAFISSEDVGNNEPITAVLFGATPMTIEIIGSGVSGSNANDLAIAYLVNPGTIEQTITVTGGQHDRLGVAALTLDNVDQSTTIDASDSNGGTSSPLATSSTTTNDSSFVLSSVVSSDDLALLSVVGGTEILEFAPPSSKMAIAESTQSTAGTYTHTWTMTIVQRGAVASVAFNLASGSGVTVTTDFDIRNMILNEVTTDFDIRYSIASSLVSITTDFDIRYSMLNELTTDFVIRC